MTQPYLLFKSSNHNMPFEEIIKLIKIGSTTVVKTNTAIKRLKLSNSSKIYIFLYFCFLFPLLNCIDVGALDFLDLAAHYWEMKRQYCLHCTNSIRMEWEKMGQFWDESKKSALDLYCSFFFKFLFPTSKDTHLVSKCLSPR